MKWGLIRMRSKITLGKSATIILVASMIGMGSAPSLSAVYAANEPNPVTFEVQNGQNILNINLPSDQKDLTATVENSAASIVLHFENTNDGSAITVNGQPVIDNTSVPITLNTGDNTINITENDGGITTTHSLIVTREKSSNNLLQDIKLSAGELSPNFDAAIFSYTVNTANDVTSLKVTAEAADSTAKVSVNGTAVTADGVAVEIPVGTTEVKISVAAENGEAKTYTLEVKREANQTDTSIQQGTSVSGGTKTAGLQAGVTSRPNNLRSVSTKNGTSGAWAQGSQGTASAQKPSTATLSALTVSSGTWNKTFSKNTYTYHIAVGSDVNEVTIDETTAYSGASVTINSNTSNAIQLGSQKKTIVPIVVTNGDDKKTYVLVFDKEIPQTTVTTATAANTAGNQTADIQTSKTKSQTSSTTDQTAAVNTRKNTASVSWWSRLIDSIRSFFSKL